MEDSRPELRKFGYAPGGYMFFCQTCKLSRCGDKRASCCLECAEKKLAAELPNQVD